MEHPPRTDQRPRIRVSAVGDNSLFRERRSQAHPNSIHLRFTDQTVRHHRGRLQGRGGIRGVPAHSEHRPRLGRAQVRLATALQLERAEAADRDGDHEKQQQIQPLLRRSHGEGVQGPDEEEVVDEERRHGCRDGEPAAVRHADGYDRQQVDDRSVRYVELVDEDEGKQRDQRETRARHGQPGERRAPGASDRRTQTAQHATMVGRHRPGATVNRGIARIATGRERLRSRVVGLDAGASPATCDAAGTGRWDPAVQAARPGPSRRRRRGGAPARGAATPRREPLPSGGWRRSPA